MTDRLPIDDVLPQLRATLDASRNAVLQAPPGAGKSTRVPLALLDAVWATDKKIVMLEPRRLAARAVATRMATTLGENAGRTVGYRTRLETRVGPATRIEVVTEGILTRWLQTDPALEDVALVIFDEFHERSLQADLGLALVLDAQAALREDLRVLVMSATLDGEAVAALLDDAPIITSSGRSHPVDTHYRERVARTSPQERPLADIVAATVLNALAAERGDCLVFLPGQADIHRVQRLLEERGLPQHTRVLPLYGDLPLDQQDAAIRPSAAGTRKVVLATNIAETSLTIEGVRIVVDCGLERRMRFNPATGMSRLETQRISRASAEQRRGRAGRLESGVCYRLWSESEHTSLAAQTPPEIVAADLAPLALELANWGIADPSTLKWLDSPPSSAFAQARDLLRSLDALDGDGRITDHGRRIAQLGTHPRLAHMIVRSIALGKVRLALEIAALLSERDILRGGEMRGAARDVDLRLRIDALRDKRKLPPQFSVDQGARQRVLRTIDQLARQMRAQTNGVADDVDTDTGLLLALAYPDRIAMTRGGSGRYVLSAGRGATLVGAHALARAEFLAIAELDGGEREATIRLAAPIEREALERAFASAIETRERIEWDSREQIVIARRERWLGALKLAEQRLENADPAQLTQAMLAGVRELGIAQLPWSKEACALQARIEFARRTDTRAQPPWPDVSDEGLLDSLEDWLAPWLDGITRRDHLARLDMHAALLARIDWQQQQRLMQIAPTHLTVPTGSRIPIDYSAPNPSVAVRLQELFGLQATPMIGADNVPLTLQLLSPAHRPVQVTQDLASFWARGYPDVKKELKGRYPKHYWPDDPLTAAPTARAKPRK